MYVDTGTPAMKVGMFLNWNPVAWCELIVIYPSLS